MNLRLEGRRALITNVTGPIGASIAQALVHEGVAVALHGDKEEVSRIVREIIANGGRASWTTGDLGTDEGVAHVMDRAVVECGGIDILIHNTRVLPEHGWLHQPPEYWNDLYNQNVVSLVRLVRMLEPHMRQRGWGRVVLVPGGRQRQTNDIADHSVNDAANINVTISLAHELARTGITVNTITPGVIVTNDSEQFWRKVAEKHGWTGDWKEIEERLCGEVLYGPTDRLGRAEDVATLVAFVASPVADFINGTNLAVDGGYTAALRHLAMH